MGGNATIIDGDVNLAQVTRRGILGRLLGKKPAETSDFSRDFVDLPAKHFQFIGEEFRAFLDASLVPPWPATKAILEYLKFATKVYLRGQSEAGAYRTWYLQITFSGCAGMAQTSSDLEDGIRFLPIGDLGYASYCAASTLANTGAIGDFTIDDSAREALAEDADRLTEALKLKTEGFVADGRCHCQMCDPQLDVESQRVLPGIS